MTERIICLITVIQPYRKRISSNGENLEEEGEGEGEKKEGKKKKNEKKKERKLRGKKP